MFGGQISKKSEKEDEEDEDEKEEKIWSGGKQTKKKKRRIHPVFQRDFDYWLHSGQLILAGYASKDDT